MKELELYIHIPFCIKKCEYCDFLSFPAAADVRQKYVGQLLTEIKKEELEEARVVTSVFIGGGTPSILMPENIADILAACHSKYRFADDAEITLEANPGTLDLEKLKGYREAGINRLSMGLQSADNLELKKLGRIHTWEEFLEGYRMARKCGFSNINVDLMSALPGQSAATWVNTLERVLALKPEHISAYSLIIEEGTPFYEKYADDNQCRQAGAETAGLPTEEEERQMYYDTQRILLAAGYQRYEISNYARPGYECQHNMGYWQRKEYRGFGLGAASLLNEKRFRRTDDLEAYLNGNFVRIDEEELEKKAQMEETMFLGLRMCAGIDIKGFERQFGCGFDQIYGEISEKLVNEGLLTKSDGKLALTEKGIDVSNAVLAEFLLE